ncbi:MAG: hypothetical protein WDN31_02090 [Hyphomicrobium sp.]
MGEAHAFACSFAATARPSPVTPYRIGSTAMQERVLATNGANEIVSFPQGTVISVTVRPTDRRRSPGATRNAREGVIE